MLLGLGEDGHTASLFPDSAAVRESDHWVVASSGAGLPRVTLTAPFINLAGLVVFMVTGEAKAPVVKRVLEGTGADTEGLPARLIRPHRDRLVWLLDQKAAALLTANSTEEGRT